MWCLEPSGGDDLPQLQAAVAQLLPAGGGVIHLGAGAWLLSGMWDLGSDTRPSSISVVGEGPLITTLRPLSPWAGPLVRVNRQKYSLLEGFSLQGSAAAVAAGMEGVRFDTGGAGSGTRSNGGAIRLLTIGQFATGLRTGDHATGQASSEWEAQALNVEGCTTGVLHEDYNSLDWVFRSLGLADCDVGLYAHSGGDAHVDVCSCSGNGTDFNLTTGGCFSLRGYRSEGARNFCVRLAGTSTAAILVDAVACDLHGPGAGICVAASGAFQLALRSCHLDGQVQAGLHTYVPSASLSLRDCAVNDTLPFRVYSSQGTLANLRYVIENCSQVDATNTKVGVFPGRAGWYDADGVAHDAWQSA